ncbi:MAG: hypothetical protein OIN83_13080 [Candidatus Methanoperedens sp.]|nr:hypothetical protein [Candidatus Methanoperedens sp.]
MADVNANNDINSEPDDRPFFSMAGYFLIGFALLFILAVLSVYRSQNKIADVEIGKGWGFEYMVRCHRFEKKHYKCTCTYMDNNVN